MVSTNTTTIDTSSPSAPGVGGIHLTQDSTPVVNASYGTGNTFDTSANGGAINITGKTVAGNNNCFAAGGTACNVPDPLPYVTIIITADAKSKTYGDADPLLTYMLTSGSLLTGDSFAGALTRNPGENVGSYSILQGTVHISGGVGNYILDYVGNNLTINPYTLTVNADPQSKIYGSADPALTYSFGPLANGDGPGVFTGSLTRDPGENVGNYAITQGTLSAGSNYVIAFTGNILAITPTRWTVDRQSAEQSGRRPRSRPDLRPWRAAKRRQ